MSNFIFSLKKHGLTSIGQNSYSMPWFTLGSQKIPCDISHWESPCGGVIKEIALVNSMVELTMYLKFCHANRVSLQDGFKLFDSLSREERLTHNVAKADYGLIVKEWPSLKKYLPRTADEVNDYSWFIQEIVPVNQVWYLFRCALAHRSMDVKLYVL